MSCVRRVQVGRANHNDVTDQAPGVITQQDGCSSDYGAHGMTDNHQLEVFSQQLSLVIGCFFFVQPVDAIDSHIGVDRLSYDIICMMPTVGNIEVK